MELFAFSGFGSTFKFDMNNGNSSGFHVSNIKTNLSPEEANARVLDIFKAVFDVQKRKRV